MRLPKSLYVFNDVSTFLFNAASIFGTVVALMAGTSVTLSGGRGVPSFSLEGLPLSLRLVIFVAIASALGWGLGVIVAYYSRSKKEGIRLLCPVLGMFWGGLLIGTAQWSMVAKKGPFPELVFFTLIGMGVVFRLSTFQFRASAGTVPTVATRCRCDAVLAFAVSTVFVLFLSELSGA